jgi:D-alanyl-D-alanine carboxypeptidase
VRGFILVPAYLLLLACQGAGTDCGSGRYTFPERQLAAPDLTDVRTPGPGPLSPALARRLEQQWRDLLADDDITSLGVALAGPEGFWASPDAPAPRFYWASVGKLFTSVVFQQLVQEGRLNLEQVLAQWYPDLPYAGRITVEMLLSHRSGFASHNEFQAFREREQPVTPKEVADFLRDRPLLFCPGTNWYYSNSAYMLLGRIIEAVTGRSYIDNIRTRIAEPIGATSIEALPQGVRPDDVAPITPAGGAMTMAPGDPFSAGNIVATPTDMLRFLIALLQGRLTGGAALTTMTADLYPMFDPGLFYGEGIMVYGLPDDVWVGHSGGTPGARAIVAYSLETQTYVAVVLTGAGSPESITHRLIGLLADQGASAALRGMRRTKRSDRLNAASPSPITSPNHTPGPPRPALKPSR